MIGTVNVVATHGVIVYLYLNCKILVDRIVRITERILQSNPSKVDRCLADLGTIIDEVQRCNFFWANYLAMNYYIAVFLCSIFFLCGKFFLIYQFDSH